MGIINHGEKEVISKLKKIDFSCLSTSHKQSLMQIIGIQSEMRQLSDAELDSISAAFSCPSNRESTKNTNIEQT